MTDSESRSPSTKKKWRRKRKNNFQISILIEKFNLSLTWSKEEVVYLAAMTGLSEAQVYKWGWDYKKKLKKKALKSNSDYLMCIEKLSPSKIDLEMSALQKSYKDELASLNGIKPVKLFF